MENARGGAVLTPGSRGPAGKEPSVGTLGPGDVAALDALVDVGIERRRVELIDGILYELPVTSFEHGYIASVIVAMLVPAYQLGRGGPGGWWIQGENDFCASGREVFRPDAIGWRRERIVGIERDRRVEIVPDWVCEVLSSSTRTHDLEVKVRAYARVGVRHGWYVDPLRRERTVHELRGGEWRVVQVCADRNVLRAAPFGDIVLELKSIWVDPRLP